MVSHAATEHNAGRNIVLEMQEVPRGSLRGDPFATVTGRIYI